MNVNALADTQIRDLLPVYRAIIAPVTKREPKQFIFFTGVLPINGI